MEWSHSMNLASNGVDEKPHLKLILFIYAVKNNIITHTGIEFS